MAFWTGLLPLECLKTCTPRRPSHCYPTFVTTIPISRQISCCKNHHSAAFRLVPYFRSNQEGTDESPFEFKLSWSDFHKFKTASIISTSCGMNDLNKLWLYRTRQKWRQTVSKKNLATPKYF